VRKQRLALLYIAPRWRLGSRAVSSKFYRREKKLLSKKFKTSVLATQTGICVKTDELIDALASIKAVCEKQRWKLLVWDKALGIIGRPPKQRPNLPGMPSLPVVDTALEVMHELINTTNEGDTPLVVVFKNFHLPFERQREELVAACQHVLELGKLRSIFVVGLMPPEAILPPEVSPLFSTIEHELPDLEELTEILDSLLAGSGAKADATLKHRCAHAALGLTRLQAEGIFAACLVEQGQVDPLYIWREKAGILNREGLVTLHESKANFDAIGGLEGAKEFLKRLCTPDPLEQQDTDARAKGVVAVGPPGVGKSLLAYCLGNEVKIPTLLANPGNLMDQYVGNTEKNTRKFFQILRRMAPCIVVMDEVGQVMPSGRGHDDSSGVSKRMLGTFLTEMNDMKEPVFWFFTANDISSLHEAFLRAERIDAKLYVRLPGATQRAVIWRMYLRKFFPKQVLGQDDPQYIDTEWQQLLASGCTDAEQLAAALMTVPAGSERDQALATIRAKSKTLAELVQAELVDDSGWTPAEIRACCRLMRRLRLSVAATSKRVSRVCAGDKGTQMLERLDRWAHEEGAIDAETGELFVPATASATASATTSEPPSGTGIRRRVRRDNAE
jgi:hypothetical protein